MTHLALLSPICSSEHSLCSGRIRLGYVRPARPHDHSHRGMFLICLRCPFSSKRRADQYKASIAVLKHNNVAYGLNIPDIVTRRAMLCLFITYYRSRYSQWYRRSVTITHSLPIKRTQILYIYQKQLCWFWNHESVWWTYRSHPFLSISDLQWIQSHFWWNKTNRNPSEFSSISNVILVIGAYLTIVLFHLCWQGLYGAIIKSLKMTSVSTASCSEKQESCFSCLPSCIVSHGAVQWQPGTSPHMNWLMRCRPICGAKLQQQMATDWAHDINRRWAILEGCFYRRWSLVVILVILLLWCALK